MANATILYFDEIWDYDKTSRIFRTIEPKNDSLWVTSFEDGVATVDPICGTDINTFAKLIAGCFDEKSNFATELLKGFDLPDNTPFTSIKFVFNGALVTVTKENADANKIFKEWNAAMEANAEKYRLEREAYMKTPEYRAERAKQLKIANRRKRVEEDVLSVDKSTELEFKDDEAAKNWAQFVEINSKDGYSAGVVTYARRWAKYMQYLMKKHNKDLVLIADEASKVADIEGITGFMYECAVNTLSQLWKYGEELRKWHNKDYGYEGDGVVNPAILTVSK